MKFRYAHAGNEYGKDEMQFGQSEIKFAKQQIINNFAHMNIREALCYRL